MAADRRVVERGEGEGDGDLPIPGLALTPPVRRPRREPIFCGDIAIRIARDGSIYTAESGPPVVVKHFDREGKFLGVVALPDYSSGCVRVTVDFGDDGNEVYLLDTAEQSIHVFAARKDPAPREPTATPE